MGAVVRGNFRRFTIRAAVVAGVTAILAAPLAAPVQADELAIPFACAVTPAGGIELTRGPETFYPIIGAREERPFTSCADAGGTRCETMMVHRFTVACANRNVAFSAFAEAARKIGIAMPAGLPAGFAPVSPLAGRFILPSLTSARRHVPPPVETQDLSPDGVRHTAESLPPAELATAWQTQVSAELMPEAPGAALRVAAVIVASMLVLLIASLAAAGRLPRSLAGVPGGDIAARLQSGLRRLQTAIAALPSRWRAATSEPADEALVNAVASVYARLAEAELMIASLAPDLLLREVLASEVSRVRERMAAAEKDMGRRPPEKTAALARILLRELDRIQRIAHSAAVSSRAADGATAARAEIEMPRSVAEAYSVLGINPDAAPAAAKKLIDALRMSWHPDHARDEADRKRREERMKQINAAWDMINGRRAAA